MKGARRWNQGRGRIRCGAPFDADVLGFALVAPGLVQVLEMVAAVYCVALFVPLVGGYFWSGASEAGAVGAMTASGGIAMAWRGLGFEEQTGLHMLNLALPAAVVALVELSLFGPFGPFTGVSKENSG